MGDVVSLQDYKTRDLGVRCTNTMTGTLSFTCTSVTRRTNSRSSKFLTEKESVRAYRQSILHDCCWHFKMRFDEMAKNSKRPKRPRNVIAMMAKTMRRGVLKHTPKKRSRPEMDENDDLDDKDETDVSVDDSKPD